MMSSRNWPHLRTAIQLTPYSDSNYPTYMLCDDDVKEIEFINYNTQGSGETRLKFMKMKWLEPEAFLRKSNSLNGDADNVDAITDPTGIQLQIRKDKSPEYYTSFDDTTLVFDSYDEDVDSTLQSSKFQAMAYVMPTWTHTDSSVPNLPDEAFIALLEEAKSKTALKLNQSADQKAEQESMRQQRWLSRKAWKVNGGIKYPNYGRKRRCFRDPTFEQDRSI